MLDNGNHNKKKKLNISDQIIQQNLNNYKTSIENEIK